MISANFKIADEGNELVGISEAMLKSFLQTFARTHKEGPVYILKIVQMNHSQRVMNYLRVIFKEISEHTGYTASQVEKLYLRKLELLVAAEADDRFTKDEYYDEDTADPLTAELIERKMKSLSKFTNKNMASFIDLIHDLVEVDFEGFIWPDPKDYAFQVEGKKNEVQFPNEKIRLT